MSYRAVIEENVKQARKAGKLIWNIDVYVRGLPRYQKRHYGTRTEIARLEAKIHEKMLTKVGQVSGTQKDLTFNELADWYIEYVRPLQKSWQTTVSRIKNINRFLEATGQAKKKLSEFHTSDVIDYMRWRRGQLPMNTKKPVSEVTIKREVVCWKTMIKFVVESHEFNISHDFTKPVKMIKEDPKFEDGLTVEQYQQLLDHAADYLQPVLEFAGNTGWRKSEILRLRLRRVKLFDVGGFALLEDSKNNTHRMTTVPSDLADTIANLPSWGTCDNCNKEINHTDADCKFVFTRNGKPIKDIRKVLKNAYRDAGLMGIYDVAKPLHRFRNFFRTNHAEMGTDIAVIMQEGGWKDTNMMMRYLDRRKSMRRNIAENYSQYLKKKSATVVELQNAIVKKM